jgi:hypothetical protein
VNTGQPARPAAAPGYRSRWRHEDLRSGPGRREPPPGTWRTGSRYRRLVTYGDRSGAIPDARICHTVDGATMTPSPASSPWIRRYPHDSFSRASRSTTDRTVRRTGGRPERPGGTTAPSGGGGYPGASAESWLGSRSAATRPGARPAASQRATPATPGPATSTSNEPSAAHAGPPRADGAATGSRRPSTTPPATTDPALTRHG